MFSWLYRAFGSATMRFIVSSQFEMFQARVASEEIEGDVEHMIGFGVRHVHIEDRTTAIDGLGEPDLSDHLLHNREPAAVNGVRFITQLKLRFRAADHRSPLPFFLFSDSALPLTLLCIELSSYTVLHLKTSLSSVAC